MRGDMILLPTQSLEIHGTHFIDLEVRTGESTVGPWSQVIVFEYGNPELAIQHPNHYAFFFAYLHSNCLKPTWSIKLFLKHRILKFRWLRKIWHRACKGSLATMRTFFIRNIYPKIFASPYFLAILGMSGSLTLVVSASFLLISPQCVTYSFCR